jgi:IS605 OrfB family transposase
MTYAPNDAVGMDLGLKEIAATSDGAKLEAGHFYRNLEQKIAQAQRRAHQRQAKRLHRRAARCRREALHRFTRMIVDTYQNIVIGDVSSLKLAKTSMAKSVLDAGWGLLKVQLQSKGQQAGRSVFIINESHTTRTCSSCRALTGPKGLDMLLVRTWLCSACGDMHDRDVNAAKNILFAWRCSTSVCGNELSPFRCAAEPGISPARGRNQRTFGGGMNAGQLTVTAERYTILRGALEKSLEPRSAIKRKQVQQQQN